MTMHARSVLFSVVLATVACGGAAPAVTPAPVAAPVAAPTIPVAVAAPAFPTEDDAAVAISPRNPTWGSRTALVTIVEFSDMQCPYCARVLPTLSALREKYGPEKLRIVWKNTPLPFHPQARPAAEAAAGVFELAGARAFWAFHDLAFQNQQSLGAARFTEWARQAGVADAGAVTAGLTSGRWADVVDADVRDGKVVGVEGTPSFFVNGVFVVGAQPLEKFTKIVDEELGKAQAKIDHGTPRERVYAEMARENRVHAPPPPENEEEDQPEDNRTVFKVPLGSSPARGPATALVTVVEFGDYQCPFTARVQATLRAIRDKYGDKVRLVYRNEPLPFHPRAEPAAQAALEVRAEKGDAAFWKMHDRLFEEQKDLSDAVILKLATEAGANAERVRAAMKRHTHAAQLGADQDAADDFQASGTPHFFIDGRRLVGAQPEEKFDAIIDQELVRAQGLVAHGTPPSGLYEALTRAGQGPPEPEKKTLPVLPPGEPVRGNPLARVTVHEWADFQCPFCARVETTLEQLRKEYGPRVRLVWHDMPLSFHQDAPLAAQAGREAFQQKGSAGFWAMHDLLFADQSRLKKDDLALAARALGLDVQRFVGALDNEIHVHEVEAEKKTADDMSISGTPAFLVVPAGSTDGFFLSGAQPYSKFKRLVERALSEAK
jgi:protein-disulfide isomerase